MGGPPIRVLTRTDAITGALIRGAISQAAMGSAKRLGLRSRVREARSGKAPAHP